MLIPWTLMSSLVAGGITFVAALSSAASAYSAARSFRLNRVALVSGPLLAGYGTMMGALKEISDPRTSDLPGAVRRFASARDEVAVVEPATLAHTSLAGANDIGAWLRDVATNLCISILDEDFADSKSLQLQIQRGKQTHEPSEVSDDIRPTLLASAYYLTVTNVLRDLPQPESSHLNKWEPVAREHVVRAANNTSQPSVYHESTEYQLQRSRVLNDFVHGWFAPWCSQVATELTGGHTKWRIPKHHSKPSRGLLS